MKKYNIIGDIHARKCWKDLVSEDRINIFVGDYFDSYDFTTFRESKKIFLDIISFAKSHEGTILLLGNHDLHYFHKDDKSRMSWFHADEIKKLFQENIEMFSMAYAVNDKILVTHAGVSADWLESTDYKGRDDANSIADWCNQLLWDHFDPETKDWSKNYRLCGMKHYMFSTKGKISDYYGTTPTQSPAWIRPQTLEDCYALADGMQIVGHTQVYDLLPKVNDHFILVDCLGSTHKSLFVDVDGENINYIVNDVNIK